MVFLPFGFIFCEKATNAASITIRATWFEVCMHACLFLLLKGGCVLGPVDGFCDWYVACGAFLDVFICMAHAAAAPQATVELLSPEGRDDFNQFCSQIPEGHVSAALQNMMPKLNFAAAPPVTVPPAPASVGHGVDGADSAMEEPNGETDEKSQSHGIKAEVKVEKRDESGPGQDNRSLGAVAPAAAEIASSGNDDAADAQAVTVTY